MMRRNIMDNNNRSYEKPEADIYYFSSDIITASSGYEGFTFISEGGEGDFISW
jgi:hypothetical protein